MSKQLKAVLADMAACRGDLELMARTQIVNADDLLLALLEVKDDTAEGVCLRLLAKYNPAAVKVEEPAP